MSKRKQNHLNDLVKVAFKIDSKRDQQHQKTEKLKRMSVLARKGLKQTEEYNQLEKELSEPKVIDFSNEIDELQKIVKRLKRFNWDF